ncbi:MAG: ATP-binding protein [Promethearchaeota archaeon]
MIELKGDKVDFSTGALRFWNLTQDPFSGFPLKFKSDRDFKILVKTETINVARDITKQIKESEFPISWLAKGSRGAGKSTAMRYIMTQLDQDYVFPIMVNIDYVDDSDLNSLALSINRAIFSSIYLKLKDYESSTGTITYETKDIEEIISCENLPRINLKIMELKNFLTRLYPKLLFIIDNLDKPRATDIDVYLDYFRTYQGFYEKLLLDSNSHIMIAVNPYMYSKFKTNIQVRILNGKKVEITNWEEEELTELIEKRLKTYCESSFDFQLSKFFTRDALEQIFRINSYNPSKTMNAVRQLMQKSYEESENPKTNYSLKPIRLDFVRRFQNEAQGFKGIITPKDFELVDSHIIKNDNYLESYEIVKRCIESHDDISYEIIDGLITIYEKGKINDLRTTNILIHSKIIEKEKSGRFKVDKKVRNFIEYLHKAMDMDLENVKTYLFNSTL